MNPTYTPDELLRHLEQQTADVEWGGENGLLDQAAREIKRVRGMIQQPEAADRIAGLEDVIIGKTEEITEAADREIELTNSAISKGVRIAGLEAQLAAMKPPTEAVQVPDDHTCVVCGKPALNPPTCCDPQCLFRSNFVDAVPDAHAEATARETDGEACHAGSEKTFREWAFENRPGIAPEHLDRWRECFMAGVYA